MKAKWYLVAVICFAVATVAGLVALVSEKGHWSQVAIPFALLMMAIALWWQARRSTR